MDGIKYVVFTEKSLHLLGKKVSKQNSILDFIDPYRILWKAIFDESHMYGLEGDLSYLSRFTLQYGAKNHQSLSSRIECSPWHT